MLKANLYIHVHVGLNDKKGYEWYLELGGFNDNVRISNGLLCYSSKASAIKRAKQVAERLKVEIVTTVEAELACGEFL